jgi:hypothetical protein
MRNHPTIALVCLGCLCILLAPAVKAETWRVPGQVASLPEAIDLAESGDIIEIAVGIHKFVGRDITLKPGLTIRTDTGMPGCVVLKECGCYCGDWRDRPVFILDQAGEAVKFEGIDFADFTLSCGPNQYTGNPIFHVLAGAIKFDQCNFKNTWKTIAWFDGGDGAFVDCGFQDGCGCAGAIHFAGRRLDIENSRFEGYHWLHQDGQLAGNVLDLVSGEIHLDQCQFVDNGPLVQLIRVGAGADLEACSSCFVDNATMWEGEVAGHAVLDCCQIDPILWHVLPGGDLVIIDDPGKAAVRNRSLSAVRSLFE